MKLKDCKDWKAVIFDDRTILKQDLKYMSSEQIESLKNIDVIKGTRKGCYIVSKGKKEDNKC